MTQQQVFDGGDAATKLAEWDADVRARALARLGLRPARLPRYARTVALAVLIALHALMFEYWYASRFPRPASHPSVVQVRLIDDSVAPMPPSPEPARQATNAQRASTRRSMAVQLRAEPPAQAVPPAPRLFDPDGSVRLPRAPRFTTPLEAGIVRGRELLARGHNIIHCRRSRFDNAPTPAEMATANARGAHMAHLVMGNPLNPLNDVGQRQQEDAAGEHAAEKREIEDRACDD